MLEHNGFHYVYFTFIDSNFIKNSSQIIEKHGGHSIGRCRRGILHLIKVWQKAPDFIYIYIKSGCMHGFLEHVA
jgi:hypothetical protein